MYCIKLPLHMNVAPWSRIFTKPHFSTKKGFFSQKKKKTIIEKINIRIWKYTKSKSNVTLDKFCSHLHLFGNFCQYQSEAK